MESLYDRVFDNIIERKKRIDEGKINSIASPFKRFRSEFLGIEQKKMYLVSSYTKSSKTQFSLFTFVFTPLLYAYEHREQIRVKFLFFPLEETKEDIMERFIVFLLYKLSNGKIQISRTQLNSTEADDKIGDEVLEMMQTLEFKSYVEFFEQCSIFSDTTNPTGIYMECKSYAEEHGEVHTKMKEYKDEFNQMQQVKSFDWYESADKDEYRIIFIDHLALLSTERNMNLKQTMDKMGEYCVILRNRYGFSPVIIQQQSSEGESLDAIKMNKLRPTVANLGDSKYSGRNTDVFLGLFAPIRFDLREYFGYDITKMKDNIRFLEVVLNRGGQMGGLTALYFDGKINDFKELPKPDDPKIKDFYSWLEKKREREAEKRKRKNNN